MADLISRPLIEITRAPREKRLTAQEFVEVAIAKHERSANVCMHIPYGHRIAQWGQARCLRAHGHRAARHSALHDLIGQGGANLRLLGAPGVTPLGGVPIVADGKIIGAIGISGAMSDQDAQRAMAGAAAATAQ